MAEGNTDEVYLYGRCENYLLFGGEIFLSNGLRAFLYLSALAYCFIGLSSITARFFKSMENVVKQSREVVQIDPITNKEVIKRVKIWNYAVADIALLAFGTSFPQISLATIDAIRNLGQLNAGGLGPGTLVGSAAFDLFPIHAVCVIVPRAGTLKKISDIGVWLVGLFWSFWAYVWLYIILEVWTPNIITLWEALLTVLQYGLLLFHAYAQDKRLSYLSIPCARSERPEDWVPENDNSCQPGNADDDECFRMLHLDEGNGSNIVGQVYQNLPDADISEASASACKKKEIEEHFNLFSAWRRQFLDAAWLETTESKKMNSFCLRIARILWHSILAPWRLLFAFVPPYQIAHGWIAFICSLIFISGIAYVVTKLTDLISCVTGPPFAFFNISFPFSQMLILLAVLLMRRLSYILIGINSYVIAFTALASGTSWPDLVASKIAAERQITADSAIANITCSNSVNIYIGIGIPWLIDTGYNFFMYSEPLYIDNANGLSFSLLVFFATSVGCIAVLVLRRIIFGAELGGPRLWAWLTAVYFMLLWVIFVVLSSLKVSGFI